MNRNKLKPARLQAWLCSVMHAQENTSFAGRERWVALHDVGPYLADFENRTKTKHSEKQVTSSTDQLFFRVNCLSVTCLFVVVFSSFHKNLVFCVSMVCWKETLATSYPLQGSLWLFQNVILLQKPRAMQCFNFINKLDSIALSQ